MASIFGREGVWVIKWKNLSGKWVTERTKCATKAQAKNYANDLERHVEQQRNGLTPVENDSKMNFGQLLEWYDTTYAHKMRSNSLRQSVEKHLRPTLGELPLVDVTPAIIGALLNEKTKAIPRTKTTKASRPLSPKTINHLRAFIHRIFALATRADLWHRANPATLVERAKEPKRPPAWLRPEEVRAVIPEVPEFWRAMFATAVYTAMRRGELVALQKRDIDLRGDKPTITVCRSWEVDSTKSGEVRVIPVHPELMPFLVAAMKSSTSELVFPRADGTMHTKEIDLADRLRSAMVRAGLVNGWVHKCRKCGHHEKRQTADTRRCPDDNMKLWPSPVKRTERFHDLRHTTATLLLKAGTPLAVVQRLCGHSDPAITTEIYGHLEAEDARVHLGRLSFAPLQLDANSAEPEQKVGFHGAPVVRNPSDTKSEGPDSHRFPEENQGLQRVGKTGFEPATPWSRNNCRARCLWTHVSPATHFKTGNAQPTADPLAPSSPSCGRAKLRLFSN